MAARLMVVGGGKMGEALVGGLLRGGWAAPETVVIVEKQVARRQELQGPGGLVDRYPGLSVLGEPVTAEGAIVAVKPADAERACQALGQVGVGRVLSIVAGVTLTSLEGWLGQEGPPPPVIRAMPNTPALVGAGAAAIAVGATGQEADLDWAEGILRSVGTVVRVTEPLLDGVTGLSGSGPAYIFLIAEAMIDAGVLVGLPRPVAAELTVHTILGAARLMESGDSPAELRAAVTSPGGTTAAGLRALEAASVRSAILDAVTAAAERSRQLGAS